MGLGSLETLMDALVPLEATINPALTVSRWRPVNINPPALYNWIVPSPVDIPAIGVVRDQVNLSVRIIVAASDVDEQAAAIEGFWDQARDIIDADLVEPSQSVLRTAAHMCRRTTMRNITDVFNEIPYLGLELVLQCELRRRFA